ncbi:MAG: hypothetical protein HZB51_01325 [Chloroflexi bacterium]|nr:hypothetical protein [Chloroflexota bacterium]
MSEDRSHKWLAGIDQLSILITLATFGFALAVFALTPIRAWQWSQRPFPGFVVEQTLVVSDIKTPNWSGIQLGILHPRRIVRVNHQPVESLSDFDQAIDQVSFSQLIPIETIDRNGKRETFPFVAVERFAQQDLLRLFWLPYSVGLIYLIIGGWLYYKRSHTQSARAFAFFCACASIVCGLFFDLFATHFGTWLWTFALSMLGAAFVSLTFLFPEELPLMKTRPWVRLLPYGASFLLSAWAIKTLFETSDPWAYMLPWRYGYAFTAFGILVFLCVMVYRWRRSTSLMTQLQARIILAGAMISFVPIGLWFGASLFGPSIPFDPTLYLPILIIFPAMISLAILRYRLWDIDFIIHRTLIYGVLTVLLAIFYLSGVIVLQFVFRASTGAGGDLAIILSTLGIAALFNPLHHHVQRVIDRRYYRSNYDAQRVLARFSETVRDEVELEKLTRELLDVVNESMQPTTSSLWLQNPKEKNK